MPTVYTTGLDDDGRSCVRSRRELTMGNGVYEALRLDEAVTPIAASGQDVPLLAAMTPEGGAYYNVFAWAPGAGTEMHRTISTDVDVVLQGSVELGLETETVMLQAGDIAILHGNAHSWRGGPEGGIILYNLLAGSPTGFDVGRDGERHAELEEARAKQE